MGKIDEILPPVVAELGRKYMGSIVTTQEFKKFVSDIIQKIRDAQYKSLKLVGGKLLLKNCQ